MKEETLFIVYFQTSNARPVKAKPTFHISEMFILCVCMCMGWFLLGGNDTESHNIFNAPTFFLWHFKRPNKKAKELEKATAII